jgi:hypothetical protein
MMLELLLSFDLLGIYSFSLLFSILKVTSWSESFGGISITGIFYLLNDFDSLSLSFKLSIVLFGTP